jgi:hypothetical protein
MQQRSRTASIVFWALVASVAAPFSILAALKAGAIAAVGIIAFAILIGYCLDKYGG